MQGPPADVRRLLGKVRDEMRRSVPGAAPFVYSSLGGDEYVINPNGAKPEPRVQSPAPTAPAIIATDPAPGGDSILAAFASADRKASAAGWDAFLVKYRALNYHLLYALALEKRETMRATASVTPQAPAPAPAASTTRISNPAGIIPPVASETPLKPSSNAAVWQTATLPRTKREAAKAIQTILGEGDCYSGPADGIFGRNSRAGLARYGNQAGISLDTGVSPSLFELQGVLVALSQNPGFECSAVTTVRRQPAPKKTKTAPATARTMPTATLSVPTPTVQPKPKTSAPPVSYAGRGGQQLRRNENSRADDFCAFGDAKSACHLWWARRSATAPE